MTSEEVFRPHTDFKETYRVRVVTIRGSLESRLRKTTRVLNNECVRSGVGPSLRPVLIRRVTGGPITVTTPGEVDRADDEVVTCDTVSEIPYRLVPVGNCISHLTCVSLRLVRRRYTDL